MAGIALITDSTASLPTELARRYNIHVIPTYVIVGGKTFLDGVDLAPGEFYRLLQEAETLPTTSQPSVGDFVELYTELSQEAEDILSIHLSDQLSATMSSALAARKEMGAVSIYIIDSRSASMGLGFIVLAAARAVEAGKGLPQVIEAIESLIPRMNVIFVVDTLEYLRRGGRIGGASALIGSILSIKPILYLKDGRVEVLEKVRTKSRAKERLLEIMAERLGSGRGVHVAILHADALEEAQVLEDQIVRQFEPVELYVDELNPVVGTHVGPGTIGLVFYAEEEAK